MSSVEWSSKAKQAFHRYRRDDPEGADQILDAVNLLANDPEPAGAHAYGRDTYRIRVGLYRIMYTIKQRKPLVLSIDILGRPPVR